MDGLKVELLVANFDDESAADAALSDLKKAKKDETLDFVDAAVIKRTEAKKIHIKETEDVSGGTGALFGTVIGAVIGGLAGPLGAVVVGGATGAIIGGLAGRMIDMGIPNQRLRDLAESLTPGTSAVVVVVDSNFVTAVEQRLEEANANVQRETITSTPTEINSEGSTNPEDSDPEL